MAKLTEEIKALLALEDGFAKELCWIATVKEDGTPNIGPKRSCRVYDDETLIWNENTAGEIMRNIKRGSKVAIGFVDRPKLDGYRLIGTAEVFDSGEYYDECVKFVEGKDKTPKAAVVFHIEEIYTLKKGPTAGTKLA